MCFAQVYIPVCSRSISKSVESRTGRRNGRMKILNFPSGSSCPTKWKPTRLSGSYLMGRIVLCFLWFGCDSVALCYFLIFISWLPNFVTVFNAFNNHTSVIFTQLWFIKPIKIDGLSNTLKGFSFSPLFW